MELFASTDDGRVVSVKPEDALKESARSGNETLAKLAIDAGAVEILRAVRIAEIFGHAELSKMFLEIV